jgi:hypothetical protein
MQCQTWNLQINKQLNIKKVSTAVDKAVDTCNTAEKLYTAYQQRVDNFYYFSKISVHCVYKLSKLLL